MQFQQPDHRQPFQPLLPVPPQQTPSKPRWIAIGVVIAVAGILFSAVVPLLFRGKSGGILHAGESDVGKLAELASVQSQLMPLDACELRYNLPNRQGRRSSNAEYIHIESCPGALERQTTSITIKPARGGFTMKRSSVSEPFEIWVEKDDIPFSELQAMLGEFAPIIAATYASKLATNRAQRARDERDIQRATAAEAARKAGARDTYPTK